jgi:hypothetical protein
MRELTLNTARMDVLPISNGSSIREADALPAAAFSGRFARPWTWTLLDVSDLRRRNGNEY